MITVDQILKIQRDVGESWLIGAEETQYRDMLERLVAEQHGCNLLIWEYEDAARTDTPHASKLTRQRQEANRRRNKLTSDIDRLFLPISPDGEMHTETPGMIIDRLSILEVGRLHGMENSTQIVSLAQGLRKLLADVWAGRKQYQIHPIQKAYADENEE